MITRTKITLLLTISSLTSIYAQVKENEIQLRDKTGQAKIIKLKETKVSDDSQAVNIFLKSQYNTNKEIEFKSIKQNKPNDLGFKVEKLQQYYKGIKVEFSVFNAVSKDGRLKSTNGEYLSIKNLNTTPKLTEKEALQLTLSQIGAKEYMWESPANNEMLKQNNKDQNATYFPKGELVIIKSRKSLKARLAYKFDVYATNPLSRANYYIDAINGEVILINSILKHVLGTADTRYSGQRTIETEQVGNQFRLRDTSRGNGIQTFNIQHNGFNSDGIVGTNNAIDINDGNNNWTAVEYNNGAKDNAALDAHWGAMMTYDYFMQEHARNSIDGAGYELRNYVHFKNNYDNAFWDGDQMVYGDGYSQFDAVVSLDVIAHEIGHGFYDKAVGETLYERESGAVNEGLSDIWGVMVEEFAAPEKVAYLIGEDIAKTAFAIRSISDPHSLGQPDTYGDNDSFWVNPDCGTPTGGVGGNDFCGVHTNSGVFNYWFYLLAEGGVGTNENGDYYSLSGIGKSDAAEIVYWAQTTYFTPTTNFQEARIHTIQAAEDRFGTIESNKVNDAWFAVGVENGFVGVVCNNQNTTLTIENNSNQFVTWQTSSNLQTISSNNTSITLRANNNITSGIGFFIANFGGNEIINEVWVGKPLAPASSISGAGNVSYGALVNYSGVSTKGATSYKWYLPYPYDQNASVTTNPLKWGIISGGSSRYLQSIVGPNNGYVQMMGVNKCGTGGVKSKYIAVSSSGGGGGGKPGGGQIPLSLNGNSSEGVLIFPNPASSNLTINLNSKEKSSITLYDINAKVIYTTVTNNFQKTIDLSNFKNGTYFIKVIGENNIIEKIIIQH